MPNIIRYRPASLLDTLQNELNSLWGESNKGSTYSNWTPSVDVQTKDDKYIVKADIPGVNPEDIQVHMDGNLLTIEGERKSESKEEEEGYTRLERFVGRFSRSFTLPDDIAEEDIIAKSANGVLTLTIPKTTRKKAKKIEVKRGE